MNPQRWHRHLVTYTRAYRRSLLLGSGLTIVQAILVVALPWPMKLAVDNVLRDRPLPSWASWVDAVPGASGPLGMLVVLAAAVVLLVAADAGLDVVRRVWRRSVGLRMANDLAHDTLELVQRSSPLSPGGLRAGDLVQRIVSDSRCVDTLVFGVWMTVLQSVVTFALLAAVMLAMSPALALVAAGVGVPMLVSTRLYRDRMHERALALADAQGSVMTRAEEMLSTLPEVQSHSAEDAGLRRFTSDVDRQVDASIRSEATSLGFQSSVGAITAAGTGVVMVLGGLRALNGALTIGELLVFLSYLSSIYGPVEGLAFVAQSMATARAGAVRVLSLSAGHVEVPEPAHPVLLPPARRGATVTFEQVSFGYHPGRPVLSDIDLEISEGESVAIVGRTGAGKSSLVSLVPRFLDPWSGAVRIDGVDVRDVSVRAIRQRVALVRQDPLLLPVSIRENIAYGTPHADDARVRRAAEAALAAEFIEALPRGYETTIGEHGATLSGGQRQRLAIARALCRGAPILILDEPTASLDAESEARLLSLLRIAAAGRTILVVAHRLSTVRAADRIVVLDHGRIVEQGSHVELARRDGVYARYLRIPSGHGNR